MKRCPCCGYLTIDDTDELITDICDVAFGNMMKWLKICPIELLEQIMCHWILLKKIISCLELQKNVL